MQVRVDAPVRYTVAPPRGFNEFDLLDIHEGMKTKRLGLWEGHEFDPQGIQVMMTPRRRSQLGMRDGVTRVGRPLRLMLTTPFILVD